MTQKTMEELRAALYAALETADWPLGCVPTFVTDLTAALDELERLRADTALADEIEAYLATPGHNCDADSGSVSACPGCQAEMRTNATPAEPAKSVRERLGFAPLTEEQKQASWEHNLGREAKEDLCWACDHVPHEEGCEQCFCGCPKEDDDE